jgi:hypothetical protein
MPAYKSVLPYEIFEGRIIYLCPTSHHALTLYLKACEQRGGPPKPEFAARASELWPHVVQRLGKLIWAVRTGEITEAQYMRAETVQRMIRRVDG